MKQGFLRTIFALGTAFTTASFAQAAPPVSLHDAEMDGRGHIWAEGGAPNQLQTFDGRSWSDRSVPFSDGIRATPLKLARFNDGSVACFWGVSSGTFAVSRHDGEQSRIILQASGSLPARNPEWENLFCDSKDRVWITGRTPQVRWVDPQGNSKVVYELTASDLVNPLQKNNSFNPLFATEDGRKRVWIWANAGTGAFSRGSLNGILLCDGDSVERKVLPGLEGKLFGPVFARDDRHMWVAVQGDGIYEVDIDTLAGRRIEDPEKKAFASLQQMFRFRDDVYVVTDYPAEGRLWRLRDGQWSCLIDSLEKYSQVVIRPWLADGDRLILASRSCLWIIPPDGSPQRWGWDNGFPIEGVDRMFLLPEHHLFALSQGGEIFVGKIDMAASSARIEELRFKVDCVPDAAGRVWYVGGIDRNVLKEWNGREWLSHAFPEPLARQSFYQLSPDEQGRIWIFPYAHSRPAAFFDSRTGAWKTFETALSALDSQSADRPRFLEPVGWPIRSPLYHPSYHENRMACLTENRNIAYFDGKSWRFWKRREIDPELPGSGAGRPFFDELGQLCVNIGRETWMWNEGKPWTKTKIDNRYPDEESLHSTWGPDTTLPDEARADGGRSIFRDNHGTFWYFWKKDLYKAVPGSRVPVFSPGEPNPFFVSRQLNYVFVDPTGVAFIKTSAEATRWYMLRPRSPLPEITASLDEADPFCPVASWRAVSGSDLKFRWQLDDAPWQWTSESRLPLEGLTNADHTLRVEAVDGGLQSSRPVTIPFKSQADPAAQTAVLVQRLGDPDFGRRESAVAALLRRPDAALPALEKARAAADKDQRWWIDATIQQIEAQAPGKAKADMQP